MFAVKGLGSYISRGVSTVSRPLQPYGGAVDIIVVEQPDGSYKSCPWYVRFGKSQVGLQPWEKIVTVCVNDVEADFHMYLDNNGDAYFLREVEGEDGEGGTFTDEIILSPRIRRMLKSKSCDYDANRTSLGSEFEADNANLLAQTNGRRGGFLGLSFRKSGNSRDSDAAVGGATSLERAEMAADLLEVRWTTNLAKGEKWNNTRHVPKPKLPVSKVDDENVTDMTSSSINSQDVVNGPSSSPGSEQSAINKESDSEIPCSVDPENNGEINSLVGTGVGVDLSPNGSEISSKVDNGTQDMDRNGQSKISEVSASVSEESRLLESEQNVGCLLSGEECPSTGNVSGGGSLANSGSETNIVVTSMSTATEENVICHLDECNGESNGALLVSCERLKDRKDQVSVISSEPGVLPRLGTGRKEDNVDHLVHCNGDERTLVSATESECSADEQFSFSDLDDGKVDKADHVEVSSLDDGKQYSSQDVTETGEKDVAESTVTRDDGVTNHSSITFESKGVSSPINIPNHCYDAEEEFTTTVTESVPAINQFGRHQLLGRSLDSKLEAMKFGDDDHVYSDLGVHFTPRSSHISDDTNSIISDPAVEVSLCRHLLYGGMGYEAAACAFDAEKLDKDKFASLCPDIVNNDKLVVRIGGLYFPWDAALPIASAIGSQGREQILEAKGMIAVGQADITAERTPQKNMNPRNGSWKLWPFSFRRTNNLKTLSNESNSTRKDRNKGKDETMEKDENKEKAGSLEKDENKEKDGSTKKGGNTVLGERKVVKRTIRAKTPTSEQLASLKLNSGKNYVTFTLSTEALGKQQVDARIFLWKWDARIVISDVDGTITKSDVLGHVMPLMGYDWSHFGVTHLFSAIKENGYKLLFLSARSILQASITRQFLINLKQDGKTLPEGPIVISPDGIFPSLYREVIRRAPHEFKISCLEDIKALFPRDHNPFYAGFGNRDTDELSYLKVGIPRGKIFTINPKGEVAVNRRVDTKSYTSLHSLVHDIFPETPVIEPEDYNQWNFWRLPPPDVKI